MKKMTIDGGRQRACFGAILEMAGLGFAVVFAVLAGLGNSVAGTEAQKLPLISGVFTDHMVLQREKPVPVWGWGRAGESITVEFGPQKKTVLAGPDGKWMAKLDPMPASDESREMVVTTSDPKITTRIADVVVGEVWLASGQSNMAWSFKPEHGVLNNAAELASATDPLVRQFTLLPKRGLNEPAISPAQGRWHPCNGETMLKNEDSAVAYFFARDLRQRLNVPVGMINASCGGTSIETWTSSEAQARVPELREMAAGWAEKLPEWEAYEQQFAQWRQASEKARAAGEVAPDKPQRPAGQMATHYIPGHFFNGMIAPLIPYGLRGVIWYQGEANSFEVRQASLYRRQMELLIGDWRSRWGEELPFAWVQLPNCRRGAGWPLLREAQLQALAIPQTGMAIAIDVGESKDVHPKNKQEVARRLGLWALGNIYGLKGAPTSGPLPARHEIRDDTVAIVFTHADGGLQANGGDLTGFLIAGADRKWKPGTARIEGDKVLVSSPEVKTPVAVRYAWEDDPQCNLQNSGGLPASPFRTDDWDDHFAKQQNQKRTDQ